MNIKSLDNSELQVQLKQAVKFIRERTAEAVALLAEVYVREIHLRESYGSLFLYCEKELGFCNSKAWRWSESAMAVARDANIVSRLYDGRLSLCVTAKLARRGEILAKADGMTLKEAEQQIAALEPYAPKRDILPPLLSDARPIFSDDAVDVPHTVPPQPKRRAHVDMSETTLAMAHRLKELMPGASLDEIFALALGGLLKKRDAILRDAQREVAKVKKAEKALKSEKPPQKSKVKMPATPSQRLPLAEEDKIVARAGGRCEYESRSGRRCSSRVGCEKDHIHPKALGGPNTADNYRLLCRGHHRMMTRQSFPREVAKFRAKPAPYLQVDDRSVAEEGDLRACLPAET